MNSLIKINGNDVEQLMYKDVPVITSQMIADLHERPVKRVNEQFKRNKNYFRKDRDYFTITREMSESQIATQDLFTQNKQNEIYLFTETGYLMLVKLFRDALSWKIQTQLVDLYFKVKHNIIDINRDSLLVTQKILQDVVQVTKDISTNLEKMSESFNRRLERLENKTFPDEIESSTLKKSLERKVDIYAKHRGISISHAWKFLYNEISHRFNIELGKLATDSGMSGLDYIEKNGFIREAINIMNRMEYFEDIINKD